MPCVKRCCCCVTLRLGGITMGIMTLALSAFSIIPMAISFVHRVFLAQVVTHLLNELKKDPENDGNSGNLFVTVLLYPAKFRSYWQLDSRDGGSQSHRCFVMF